MGCSTRIELALDRVTTGRHHQMATSTIVRATGVEPAFSCPPDKRVTATLRPDSRSGENRTPDIPVPETGALPLGDTPVHRRRIARRSLRLQRSAITRLALGAFRDPCGFCPRHCLLERQATPLGENGPWRPVRESNTCSRAENAASWATRRTGLRAGWES